VVGSALVDEIAVALAADEAVTPKVVERAAELAKAVRSARVSKAGA
jgi:tryptophan synthase alpha chain